MDSDRIGGYVREATEKARANTDLLATTSIEIAKVKEQMTKTHQLYLAGAASVERFKELTIRWRCAWSSFSPSGCGSKRKWTLAAPLSLSTEAVVEEALKLQELWPSLDLERKRQIVQSLVESITVDAVAQRITLRFTCLPS